MACAMNELKTKKLRAVQGTDKIEECIGYFKMHPHEITILRRKSYGLLQ